MKKTFKKTYHTRALTQLSNLMTVPVAHESSISVTDGWYNDMKCNLDWCACLSLDVVR